MKRAKDGSVRKDWSDEWKECFNDVFCQVKDLHFTSLSATNEKTLKGLWNQSSRNQRQAEVSSTNVRQLASVVEGVYHSFMSGN